MTVVGRGNARRSAWRCVVTIAMVVVSTLYLSRLAGTGDLWTVLRGVPRRDIAIVALLAVGNVATYWLVLAASIPRLGVARAAALQLPSTAISNVLPAGGALGTGFTAMQLRRWGFRSGDIAGAMVLNGLLGLMGKVGVGVLAVLLLAPATGVGAATPAAAVAGVCVALIAVVLVLRSDWAPAAAGRAGAALLDRFARVARRTPLRDVEERCRRLQRDVGSLGRSRWPAMLGATVLSHGLLLLLFVACVRAVGITGQQATTAELVGSFAVARLASLIPLTPGGIGLIEISLTASLSATGTDGDRVVAAVAIYRAATYALPTILGLVGVVLWAIVPRSRRDLSHLPCRADVPLVVDLDGTLFPVTTRVLMVSRMAWRQPWSLVRYARLRRADRLASKFYLWERSGLRIRSAPVRRSLLRWLAAQAESGRPIYIASGAPAPLVREVVRHYAVFAGGWGSRPDLQLVGEAKAAHLIERFGSGGFDYIGDAMEDVPVFAASRHAIVCWPRRRLERLARASAPEVAVIVRPWLATPALALGLALAVIGQHPARR